MKGSSEIQIAGQEPTLPALFHPATLPPDRTEQDMLVAEIRPPDPQSGLTLFELTIRPGFERIYPAQAPGVTKHVFLLEGEMELFLEGGWTRISAGQALQFAADGPHGYRNRSRRAALVHDLSQNPARHGGTLSKRNSA